MAFFRKWKAPYKHKKFTSNDDIVEADDNDANVNKKSLNDLKKKNHKSKTMKEIELNFDEFDKVAEQFQNSIMYHCDNVNNNQQHLNGAANDNDGDDDDDNNELIFKSYDIKYLGCTPIETKRSEKVTSDAIKTVIANAKAGGRKLKTMKRVKLNVTHNGLDILDYATKDTLMRFSIYKISYCSVDAAHDHAFSFVSSEPDPLSDKEKMSCHVFLCPKRKIAHEITLLVARCFENAYQNWRDTIMQQQQQQQQLQQQDQGHYLTNDQIALCDKKILKESNNLNKSKVEIHYSQSDVETRPDTHFPQMDNNLLIDLVSNENNINSNNNGNNNDDIRKYFQNTWISFDGEQQQQ